MNQTTIFRADGAFDHCRVSMMWIIKFEITMGSPRSVTKLVYVRYSGNQSLLDRMQAVFALPTSVVPHYWQSC